MKKHIKQNDGVGIRPLRFETMENRFYLSATPDMPLSFHDLAPDNADLLAELVRPLTYPPVNTDSLNQNEGDSPISEQQLPVVSITRVQDGVVRADGTVVQPIIFEFERTVNPDDPHALDQPLTVSCGFGISHSSVFTARNSDGIVVSHPVRVADLLGRSHEVTFQPGETKVQWVYEEINYSYYTNETHIDVGIDDQSFMAPEDQQYVVGLNRSVSAGVQLDQTPEQQVSFNTSDNAKYYDSPVPEKESVSPTDETQAWGYNPWVVKEISWIPPDEAAAQACGAEGNSTLQSLYEQGRVWQIVKLHNTETQEEMSIAEFSDEAFAAMNPVDYVTTVDSPVNHVVKAKSEVPAALSENIPELAAGFVPFSSIPSETSAVSLDVHGTFEDRIVEIDTYFHQVESQHDKDLHFGREPRRAVCSRPFQGGRFQ